MPRLVTETERNPALSDTEIDAIAERLRAGEPLDERYRPLLFPQAKEATLSYAGKESRGSILARTMAVPFQALKTFGTNGDWSNKLVFGDNLQVLKTLLELKDRGQLVNADGSRGVRLCYIDPPFATKREFRGKKGQLAYRDKVEGAEFVEFLRKRLVLIHELLADDGVLYLHLDTNKVHYMKAVLDEIFGPTNFRTEIIWKRSTAHSDTKQGRAQHGRIHDTILFYTKGDAWVWSPVHTAYDEDYVRERFIHEEPDGRRYKDADLTAAKPGGDTSFKWHVKAPEGTTDWQGDPEGEWRRPRAGWTYKAVPPSKGRFWAYSRDNFLSFHAEDLLYYTSKGTPRLKQYAEELEGVSLQDIWTDIYPINSQALERLGYPTQKPEALLERIITSSTHEGDLVLDCFGGSGTTAVAAERLGRRWITVDCGKFAVYTAQRRLLSLNEGNGKSRQRKQAAPFELCHAGLYDNELLEDLPPGAFTDFALDLFGCVKRRQKIAGIEFAGTRNGGPVHIFPFGETEAEMGLDYIESLHERIGDKVSGAVYIVVPVAHCDPGLFEDVITRDRATYFILRVPYSVIEALHERDFQLIGQPASREELNDALDSFGFDFMELPEATITWEHTKGSLVGAIKEFHRGGLDPDGFRGLEDKGRIDLAMVLVDRDWDGDGFRVEDYTFAEELRENKWKLELDLEGSGERLLIVFMDTHGNELRQVIEPARLNKYETAPRRARAKKASGTTAAAKKPAAKHSTAKKTPASKASASQKRSSSATTRKPAAGTVATSAKASAKRRAAKSAAKKATTPRRAKRASRA